MLQKPHIPWSGWKIEKILGTGSLGTVYAIRQEFTEVTERAAMKVISIPSRAEELPHLRSQGLDDDSIARIFLERRDAVVNHYSTLMQPGERNHMVGCSDVQCLPREDGLGWDIYIKMELLTPLFQAMHTVQTEAQIVQLGIDLCSALVECHSRNILHRDVQPWNIFVSPDGTFKLGEFGIGDTDLGMTLAESDYMPPELYNGQPYTAASDIYLVGLVLYWLLNQKRLPFVPLDILPGPGQLDHARRMRFSGEPLPSPAHGSPELQQIVLTACEPEPGQRFTDAGAMLQALQALGSTVTYYEDYGKTVVLPCGNWVPPHDPTLVSGDMANGSLSDATVLLDDTVVLESKPRKPKKKGIVLLLIAIVLLIAVVLLGIKLLPHMAQLLSRISWGADAPTRETTSAETGPGETMPQQELWSDWCELSELPDYVTEEHYYIDSRSLYSSRTLETTSSTTEKQLPGWELYEIDTSSNVYGDWSEWAPMPVEGSSAIEVQSKVCYRSRTKLLQTGPTQEMEGWTYYTTTYELGDYGKWSSWDSEQPTSSESREIEKGTQYRYRDYGTIPVYSEWSSWNSWQTNKEETDEFKDEKIRYVLDCYYYECYYCDYRQSNSFSACPDCGNDYGSYHSSFDLIYTYQGYTIKTDSDGKRYVPDPWNRSQPLYVQSETVEYAYRTRTATYTEGYSEWSDWSFTSQQETETRDVQKRTAYRYRDREYQEVYHFWQWGEWGEWSDTYITANADREVETETCYRYREQQLQTTYLFRRWTDWSVYSTREVQESETVQVRVQEQYRYRSR